MLGRSPWWLEDYPVVRGRGSLKVQGTAVKPMHRILCLRSAPLTDSGDHPIRNTLTRKTMLSANNKLQRHQKGIQPFSHNSRRSSAEQPSPLLFSTPRLSSSTQKIPSVPSTSRHSMRYSISIAHCLSCSAAAAAPSSSHSARSQINRSASNEETAVVLLRESIM